MKRIICWVILFCVAVFWKTGAATPLQGGIGLHHLYSARVLPKGHLEWHNGIRYFGKIANFGDERDAYTLWNVQGFITINYGISDHVELAISPIVYQDTNKPGQDVVNTPDDLYLSLKTGSHSKLESPWIFGGMVYARIPTANLHNIIYEPYSAGSLELGVTGFLSYFSNVAFPDEGWSLHTNLGLLNHNDVGKELTTDPGDPTPGSMSMELLAGLGILYPAGTFQFSLEFNSRMFITTQPPVTAYSRENMSYLTMGVYYDARRWLTIEMGFDISVLAAEDESVYVPDTHLRKPPTEDFPNYPSWRGILGAKFNILPYLFRSSESYQLQQQSRDRRVILERLMEEQKNTESAEDELTRIRSERQRVEEELKRLRLLLEEEEKKKKEDEN